MTPTDTIYDPFLYADGHYVTYPKVRQSDTMSIAFNDDWKRFEPTGTTPSEPLASYLSERGAVPVYPMNAAFECGQSCCFSISVVFFLVRVLRVLL